MCVCMCILLSSSHLVQLYIQSCGFLPIVATACQQLPTSFFSREAAAANKQQAASIGKAGCDKMLLPSFLFTLHHTSVIHVFYLHTEMKLFSLLLLNMQFHLLSVGPLPPHAVFTAVKHYIHSHPALRHSLTLKYCSKQVFNNSQSLC